MKLSIKKYLLLLTVLVITGCATKSDINTKKASLNVPLKPDLAIAKETAVESVKKEPQLLSHTTDIQTGRYSTVQAKPTQPQRQLLQVMISVTIPDNITTIGQTIHYLLKRSGYQLVLPQTDQPELTAFFYKRLPDVHRHIGPMTLEDALIILTAPAFTLHEDPVQRLISYDLDSRYAGDRL